MSLWKGEGKISRERGDTRMGLLTSSPPIGFFKPLPFSVWEDDVR